VHEAMAAGAFVLARKEAGHVWPAVEANAPDQGLAVDDPAALHKIFRSGELLRLVITSTRRRGVLLTGGGTAGWLLGGIVDTWPGPVLEEAAFANV
jgi:hypothetical protein